MDNSEHTHRLSLRACFFYILLSSFLLLLVFATLAVNAQDFASGKTMFSDYLGMALMVFLLLPLGLLLLASPFVTKVVVKAYGLEYHSITYTLSADWKDLANIGYVKNTPAGKSLVVVARKSQIKFRSLSTPFQKVLIQNPQSVPILVSQFGTANGHSFEADILENVHDKQNVSYELESL